MLFRRRTCPSPANRRRSLRQIDWVPISRAILLGTLGLLAVGHALVTSVRRRRGELAVLRTLGFTRGQVRAVAWQATTIVPVGLVVVKFRSELRAHPGVDAFAKRVAGRP